MYIHLIFRSPATLLMSDNTGVASALISLPLKYMHTTVETVHQDDVENVIRLIYETLLRLENGQDFRYFS